MYCAYTSAKERGKHIHSFVARIEEVAVIDIKTEKQVKYDLNPVPQGVSVSCAKVWATLILKQTSLVPVQYPK